MFLFVARKSSRGHLTSALKHDLTKDCVTDFSSKPNASLKIVPFVLPYFEIPEFSSYLLNNNYNIHSAV